MFISSSLALSGILCDDKASPADVVEGEDEVNVEDVGEGIVPGDRVDTEAEDDSPFPKPSLDADVHFLFTKPVGMGLGKYHHVMLVMSVLLHHKIFIV